jgi:hypothetical protein
VFEKRVLRKMCGPKRRLEKMHNEELHNVYCSPSIIRMIKSRRMRWARHVAQMGRRGMDIGFRWETRRKETTMKT